MKRRRSSLAGSSPSSRLYSTTDLWSIALVTAAALLVQPTSATVPVVHSGIGSPVNIADLSTASCGFMSWPSSARANYASVTTASPSPTTTMPQLDSACGRCARVWCIGPRCGTHNGNATVYIVNSGGGSDLNLSPSAFFKISGSTSGSVRVRWQFVDCPVASNADKNVSVCLMRESAPQWFALQPVNDTLGVNAIRIDSRLARLDRASPTLRYIITDPRSRSGLRTMTIDLSTRSKRAFRKQVVLMPGECVSVTRHDEVLRTKTEYESADASDSRSASSSGSGMDGAGGDGSNSGNNEQIESSPTPTTYEPTGGSSTPVASDGAATQEPNGVAPTRAPNSIENDPVDHPYLVPTPTTSSPEVPTHPPHWLPPYPSELTSTSPTANPHPFQPRPTLQPASSEVTPITLPSLSTAPGNLITTQQPEPPPASSSLPVSPRFSPSPPSQPPASRTSNSPPSPAEPVPIVNDNTSSQPAAPPRDKPGVSIPDPTMSSPNGESTPHPLTPAPPRKEIDDTSSPPKPSRPPGFSNESSDSVLTSPLFIGLLLGTVGLVGALVAYRAKVHQQHLMNRLPLTVPVTTGAAVVSTSRAAFTSVSPQAVGLL